MTNPIERLDVPLAQVEAVLRESRARHMAAGDWDEDEFIANGEALQLVTHPEVPVATDADYGPTWAADLAARIEKNKRQGGQS